MMEKEKVVFFVDYASINRAAREKRYRLDYNDLLHYIGADRFLVDAYCYVPINPSNEHRLDGEIEALWRSGYIVTIKQGAAVGRTYLCNFAVEITMDVCKVVHQTKPDILVIATSNPDFLALIQDVRKSGIRVEVAAFEEATHRDMQLKCSGFINLAVYYESYLAAQNAAQEEVSVGNGAGDSAGDDAGDGIEEHYRSLIQEQEQVVQTVQAMQTQERDLSEDTIEFSADEQTTDEAGLPMSDSELY